MLVEVYIHVKYIFFESREHAPYASSVDYSEFKVGVYVFCIYLLALRIHCIIKCKVQGIFNFDETRSVRVC